MAFLESSFRFCSSCESELPVPDELSPQPLARMVRPKLRAKIRLPIRIYGMIFMR
jgi:hypothetical protein